MESTRREVLILIVGGVVGAACGGSNSSGGPANGGNCLANGTRTFIGTNHGHVLSVPIADINAGAQKSYDIQGSADHTHTVTLTASDFASLKQNMGIGEPSTTNFSPSFGSHSHGVNVSCA